VLLIRIPAWLTVMVVIEARRRKVIIAIRVPMPADPLNLETSSYVNSESPIQTCLNRKPTRFRRKSPGHPTWKIGIDPRRYNCTEIIYVGLSRNLVLVLRIRRRTAQPLAEPKKLEQRSFLLIAVRLGASRSTPLAFRGISFPLRPPHIWGEKLDRV
jgi:hypothetical protein